MFNNIRRRLSANYIVRAMEVPLKKIAFTLGVVAVTFVASPTLAASSITARPGNDATLKAGGNLVSPNGQFTLVVQGDGNVVVYRSACVGDPKCHTWATGTNGQTSNPLFVMQADGNLVLYNGMLDPAKALWNIGPAAVAEYLLIMQDDGNLVVYSRSRPVWSVFTGRISDKPPSKSCGGNEFKKLRCTINDIARKNGLGEILSGSNYYVANLKSGSCSNVKNRFPGGDIGLEQLRSDYPKDRDYTVGYGDCDSNFKK